MSSWFIRRANVSTGGSEPTPRLPDTFTELEYLKNGEDREQYINTGIIPTPTHEVEVEMKIVGYGSAHYLFGRYSSNAQYYLYLSSNKLQWAWNSTYITTDITADNSNKHIYRLYSKDSQSHLAIDGVVVSTREAKQQTNNTYPFTLFAGGQGTIAKGVIQQVYSCVIKNNGTIIMHLIPAKRKSDDALGMYDLVSNTFLTNAGSGSFLYGEL